MANSRLFKPLNVGGLTLHNRIAMAPLTRYRANEDHVQAPFAAEYYAQRASVPGTLLVTEGTFIHPQNGGYANVPGIYNQAQIDAWRNVTEAVHKKGSYIFLQLWALGRTADKAQAEKEGIEVTSSSAVALSADHATPRALSVEEIKDTIARYAQAAKNAIAAGFDGVEIHGANGYLVDQFLQDTVNHRTDQYGGSVDNRSRFAYEVTQAVADAIGADRTAIRMNPYSTFQGMRMQDPVPQFSDIVTKLNKLGLAYLHLVAPRNSGHISTQGVRASDSLDPFVNIFNGPILIAGGYNADSARKLVDEQYPEKDIVATFGRFFISTPDLVFRLEKGIAWNEYDRNTFYKRESRDGYTDYPFSEEFLATANL